MKNLILKSLLAILPLLCSIDIYAQDFDVDGIYYKITSVADKTVEVTYRGGFYENNNSKDKYTGTVVIPESVTNKGINYSVTSIGKYAFSACFDLTKITIGNRVTSIGEYAFESCKGLTEITIPNSVTSIGNQAFNECSGLTEITIPESVTSIGVGVFQYCTGLKRIEVKEENKLYDSRENCNAIIETSTNTLIAGCSTTVIPNSVTSIGDSAFSWCVRLRELTIPNSVTSIGDYAFEHCIGLTEVTIPNSVTSIGSYAFFDCNGLTEVTIPDSITSIGGGAFYNTPFYFNQPDGVVYLGKVLYCYKGDMPYNTKIEIRNDIVSIANRAFSECLGLAEISIPNSVTSIGDYAFLWCVGLTEVTIPNSVTSIGTTTFAYCTNLKELIIPNSVTSIGYRILAGCNNLNRIEVEVGNKVYDSRENCNAIIETATNTLVVGCGTTIIPNSVIKIGDAAFSYCYGITDISIPNSVTSIGNQAFYGCTNLTEFIIPNSVTYIGDYAFSGCSGLTELILPHSVKEIGAYAVYECTGLETVTIGSGVSEIGEYAFAYCDEISIVNSYAQVPPTIYSNTFTVHRNYRITLHVVKGCKDAYANYWACFPNITDDLFIISDSILLDKTNITTIAGETVILTATIYPEDATEKGVVWSVSDEMIATIEPIDNVSAKVTVQREGTATVTATTIDGSDLSATCTIDVYSDIDSVEADAQDAEYYTIDGIKLAKKPAHGIYIMKQGNTVRKVVL